MPELDLSSLGIRTDLLPPEYANDVFGNLDAMMQRQDTQSLNNIYDQQEERGLFRGGQTEKRALEEVVGPSQDRRRQAELGMIGTAMGQQRDERLQGVAFDRQRQFAKEEFDRKLQEISLENQQQERMLRLQDFLGMGKPQKKGFGEIMGDSFAQSFGNSAGSWFGPSGAKQMGFGA